MEILIPGLLLVGFMAWASTRIKRNAAKAFEREAIETDEFSLIKPEGFLSKVDPPDGLLFSAYSKDFGKDDAEGLRKSLAEVRRFDGEDFESVRESARTGTSAVLSEQTGVIGEQRCANIIAERSVKGVSVVVFYKILAGGESVYQLSVSVLDASKEELAHDVDLLTDSFCLK